MVAWLLTLAIKSTEKLAPAKPSLGTDHEALPEDVARLENRARGPVNNAFDYLFPFCILMVVSVCLFDRVCLVGMPIGL